MVKWKVSEIRFVSSECWKCMLKSLANSIIVYAWDTNASSSRPIMHLYSTIQLLNNFLFSRLQNIGDPAVASSSLHLVHWTAKDKTVRGHVQSFANQVKASFKEEILKRKTNDERFSWSFHEWSSVRNRRFVAINAHAADIDHHLGLVRKDQPLVNDALLRHLATVFLTEFWRLMSKFDGIRWHGCCQAI